jgi:osmotically-inducible protein OsmY
MAVIATGAATNTLRRLFMTFAREAGETDMSTTTAVKSDRELQQDVLAELRWEPSVNAAQIGVAVSDGIVTLSGYVPSYPQKVNAERSAKRVYGVKAVVNKIEVKPFGEESHTDPDIAVEAVRALKWNLLVPSKKIKVSVSKGVVTLEGEVNWRFQKEAAEDAVRYLPGMKGVENHIKIKPRLSPIELQSNIEEALKRSAEVDAHRIVVEVQGGKVKLSGKVRSWAKREEAERQAWAAPGVEGVENSVVVEP